MEIPIQIVAAAFASILLFLGWQVRMLYRLVSRMQRIEDALEHHGFKLPSLQEI